MRDHGKKSFESWGITILRMPMRLRKGVIAFEIRTRLSLILRRKGKDLGKKVKTQHRETRRETSFHLFGRKVCSH